MARPSRSRMAFMIAAGTVGILALFALQFVIPYLLGPGGLIVVGALDLGLFLYFRHRRAVRSRPLRYPRIKWGPVDRRYATRRVDALEKELTATIVFVVFILSVYFVGFAIRVEYWWIDPNIALYLFGSIMTAIGIRLSLGFQVELLQSESDKFDTTEDH